MNPIDLISKKRDGDALADTEIRSLINGFVEGSIPDYQMAALCMAVYINGMTVHETRSLTEAMLESGTKLSYPDDGRPVIDKHSTGGVGDKVSLLLAPLLACCDTRVPMISGRGLGITGGTLDKLESIPGFRTNLQNEEIISIVQDIGCIICGATEDIAPADRKLYSLRDVTGTVASLPLITSSILSKKLAENPEALIFDVKTGKAAVMTSLEGARRVAKSLVDTAELHGVPAKALITQMNEPLGRACGNAVEVREVLEASKSGGPRDLVELTIILAEQLLDLVEKNPGKDTLLSKLENGEVHDKLVSMITAQGGRIDELPVADWQPLTANESGFIESVDAFVLGTLLADMGGSRKRIDDDINHTVGIKVHVSKGDEVAEGDLIAEICHATAAKFSDSVSSAIRISEDPQEPLPLVIESVG